MRYEELVESIKKSYEKADAASVGEHVAVQVNVVGEGEGAFYIEVADGRVNVEPYEYYDRDAIITASAQDILNIVSGKSKLADALGSHQVELFGNAGKALLLENVKIKKPAARKAKPVEAADDKVTVTGAQKKASARKSADTVSAKEVVPATGKAKRSVKTSKKG